jgi:hypothetical protein
MAAGLAAGAQTATSISVPPEPLLPASFGEWRSAPAGSAPAPVYSLANANKTALEEDGPQRSQVADYTHAGRTLHIEAIQFEDRTGAYSAFTLMERPGMRESKELGPDAAVGNGAVLFTSGSSLVLVNGATAADVAALKPLEEGLPKIFGNKGVAPLLPTLVPAKGLVNGSLRYALGPATYAAEGGALAADSLDWDKSAEAVTAQYSDRRGKETLTLLLYPTPMLAGIHAKQLTQALPGMGPTAKVRRDGELVILASGSWPASEAQLLVDNIHLKQEVSFDRNLGLTVHEQVVQGYSILTSILVLAGVLMGSAVLLGLFLGGGRAAYRVMRGKPAAVEVEFLSLHLAPQNKPAQFTLPEPPDQP